MSKSKGITKKKLEISKQPKEFKPTALMEKFVEKAIMIGSDNVAEIVRETGMDESTYYEWKKKEGFMEWMNQYALKLLKGDGWKLNAIGMRQARRDHKYWESMQKIVGNISMNDNQTNVQTNIQVVMPGELQGKYGVSSSPKGDNQQQ